MANALLEVVHRIRENNFLVVLLDSYEALLDLDVQLRERFFKDFPEDILLVFAGRNTIFDNCSPVWREDMHFFEMTDFTAEECKVCLRKRGIRDLALVEAIYNFTQGVPLAVAFAADVSLRLPRRALAIELFSDQSSNQNRKSSDIIDDVTNRFLSLVSESEREFVDASSVLGYFNIEALQYLLGSSIQQDVYNIFEKYSFVRKDGSNLLLHTTVRTYALRSLKQSNLAKYQLLQEKAGDYAESKLTNIDVEPEKRYTNAQWQRWTLAKIYHRLQANSTSGTEAFFEDVGDALWERNFAFALSILDIPAQPLLSNVPHVQLLRMGCVALLKQEYAEAVRIFEQLATFCVDSPRLDQIIQDTLGDLYSPECIDDVPRAVQHYERALSHFRAFGEWHKVTATLLNIAECLHANRDWEQASLRLQEAIEVSRRIEDKNRTARALRSLGHIFVHLQKYDDAEQAFQQCRNLYAELELPAAVGVVLHVLGDAYRVQGQLEQALDY